MLGPQAPKRNRLVKFPKMKPRVRREGRVKGAMGPGRWGTEGDEKRL